MYNLKLHNQAVTLVDQVEDSLLNYFREHDLRIGDSIPNELDLAAALGVARSVLREALSRLKMMGDDRNTYPERDDSDRTFYFRWNEAGG